MDKAFHKFPSTPHLFWLASSSLRPEKVLTTSEVKEFLSHPVAIEEKMDGSNLGISFDRSGRIRFQNRGNFLSGKLSGQWEQLRAWGFQHEARLRELIHPGQILFGEWCYATHSIHYDHLPDWFMVFDVFDSEAQRFWSRTRRDELVASAGLATVPLLRVGNYCKDEIISMLNIRSAYTKSPVEGVYLRIDQGCWLSLRAKVVRPGFIQSISEHWSKRQMVRNDLASKIEVPSEHNVTNKSPFT
jgi:hypothetical protein